MSIAAIAGLVLVCAAMAQHPDVANLDLHDPPVWFAARLSGDLPVSPDKPQVIPLTNGPFTAVAVTAVPGADGADAQLTIEVKGADGAWTAHAMAVVAATKKPTLHVYWPPSPFNECRIGAVRGQAVIKTVLVQ